MRSRDHKPITRRALWTAWGIAIGADLLQWVLLPLTIGAALTPIDDVLDAIVAGALLWLLGWHWQFLPSFAVKLIPVVDLAPTWTVAVWLATRRRFATTRESSSIDPPATS